jgi:hypothetical protein
MTYQEKLKDPRWQKKRLEILERDGWCCTNCGSDKSTLHVHHNVYVKNKEPWDYDNNLLQSLCEGCHKEFHSNEPLISRFLTDSIKKNFSLNDMLIISMGFHEIDLAEDPDSISTIIHWILTNPKIQQELRSKYLDSLSLLKNNHAR